MRLFNNFKKRIDANAFIDEITQVHKEDIDDSEIAFESTIYGLDDSAYDDGEYDLDSDLGEDEDEPFTFIDGEEETDKYTSESFDNDDENSLEDDLADIERAMYGIDDFDED